MFRWIMRKRDVAIALLAMLAILLILRKGTPVQAEAPKPANYDESEVPQYQLPDVLRLENGQAVTSAAEWSARRGELLELFAREVYGLAPAAPVGLRFERAAADQPALAGLATRRRVEIVLGPEPSAPRIALVIYLPASAKGPVPVFVGMHLFPSGAADPEPARPLFSDERPAPTVLPEELKNLPGAKTAEVILARGFALATIDAEDVAPDDARRWREKVVGYLEAEDSPRTDDGWGAIGAWAWALSRTLDYFETDPQIDARRVIVIGHSRMGKTALWASAQDERFAMAISNNSGCGGAALSRRWFGETVAKINTAFPHWFALNFRKYNDRENELPVDQHELIALSAPRPVYVASAQDDGWADPRGEFLAAVAADPVYRLLGVEGLGNRVARNTEMPALNRPVGQRLGYHIRAGEHQLSDYDWLRYLEFAERWLKLAAEK